MSDKFLIDILVLDNRVVVNDNTERWYSSVVCSYSSAIELNDEFIVFGT